MAKYSQEEIKRKHNKAVLLKNIVLWPMLILIKFSILLFFQLVLKMKSYPC